MSMTEKLAYIKKLRHLTTEEIAQQSGVPLGTLNKIFSGQTKNPAVGPVDKITQVLRIPIHYLLDDELPIEYHVSTSTDDGILLLSSEEIQFLMKYRDLEPHSKRAVDTMTELLNMPPGRLAGNLPVKRTFCYVTAPPGDSNPLGDSFFLRPVLRSPRQMPPPVRQTLPFCSPTAVWSRSTPPEPFCSAKGSMPPARNMACFFSIRRRSFAACTINGASPNWSPLI